MKMNMSCGCKNCVRKYRMRAKVNDLRKDFIYACVKRGMTTAEDIEYALNSIPEITPIQVAGIKAAITKGQLI